MKKDGDLSAIVSFIGGLLMLTLLNAGIIYSAYSAYINVTDGYTIAAFFWALTANFLGMVLFFALRGSS